MKKTLVAVAALVATGAFAQVTISGVAEAAIKSTGGVKTMIGGTNGSEISFGVSEDLGNGLKAMASTTLCATIYEGSIAQTCGPAVVAGKSGATGVVANTGAVNNYNSYIGLSSAEFGTIKIGQQLSNSFLTAAIGDVGGMSGLSNYAAFAGTGAGLVAGSLSYNSPSLAGFSVNYQQTLDNASTTTGGSNYSLGYANGGLTAGIANSKLTTAGAVAETTIGANYNFGVATVYGVTKTASGSKTTTGYGVAVPFGAFTVLASLTSNGTVNSTAFAGFYSLSKRTSIYAAQATADGSATSSYVGVRHNF